MTGLKRAKVEVLLSKLIGFVGVGATFYYLRYISSGLRGQQELTFDCFGAFLGLAILFGCLHFFLIKRNAFNFFEPSVIGFKSWIANLIDWYLVFFPVWAYWQKFPEIDFHFCLYLQGIYFLYSIFSLLIFKRTLGMFLVQLKLWTGYPDSNVAIRRSLKMAMLPIYLMPYFIIGILFCIAWFQVFFNRAHSFTEELVKSKVVDLNSDTIHLNQVDAVEQDEAGKRRKKWDIIPRYIRTAAVLFGVICSWVIYIRGDKYFYRFLPSYENLKQNKFVISILLGFFVALAIQFFATLIFRFFEKKRA